MGDSNLYLRRVGEQLTLAVEQPASASTTGISLRLNDNNDSVALEVADAHQLLGDKSGDRRAGRATHRGRDRADDAYGDPRHLPRPKHHNR